MTHFGKCVLVFNFQACYSMTVSRMNFGAACYTVLHRMQVVVAWILNHIGLQLIETLKTSRSMQILVKLLCF